LESGMSNIPSCQEDHACEERGDTGEKCTLAGFQCACDWVARKVALVGVDDRMKHCCAEEDEACFEHIHKTTKEEQLKSSDEDRMCRSAGQDGLNRAAQHEASQQWVLPENLALRDPDAHSGPGGGLGVPGLQVGASGLFVVTAALALRQRLRSSVSGSSHALIDEEASSE